MNSEYHLRIDQQASVWAEQLKADSAFTDSDAEELKGHLIDLTEELMASGLNQEEAFGIALARLGEASELKSDFEEVNTPVIQMRKMLLVLSGILTYFLLYFLMLVSTRLLVIILDQTEGNPKQNIKYIIGQIIVFHLFLIISTLFLYFRGKKIVKRVANLKIKPQHTFILFAGIIGLAFADQWFQQTVKAAFEPGSYTSNHLRTIFLYSEYSFPLILILCFILLYRKYYLTIFIGPTDSSSFNEYNAANISGSQMRFLLIILSGVLVYSFLYFVLFSSTRIFFTLLQHFENDPLLNIKRTWSYAMIYQALFVFFTASMYFRDQNLADRLKQIHFKPVHASWMLLATVILAITDRCFYPISKYSLMHNKELINKLASIFYISNYSFPFVLCACFLILFYKYYRDNVKIC